MRHLLNCNVLRALQVGVWAAVVAGISASLAAPPEPVRIDPAEARSQRVRSRMFSVPKPFRYDEEADEIRHYSSVWSRYNESPPGDPYAYYGDRLRQYLYFGPHETGGIYEAFETYHRQRGLDHKKYRYRGVPH